MRESKEILDMIVRETFRSLDQVRKTEGEDDPGSMGSLHDGLKKLFDSAVKDIGVDSTTLEFVNAWRVAVSFFGHVLKVLRAKEVLSPGNFLASSEEKIKTSLVMAGLEDYARKEGLYNGPSSPDTV